MSSNTTLHSGDAPLHGGALWAAALVLAAANFIAVLDMTIANVSVNSIAGGLGASTSQGTWVITSYAVAEAITVPLTGWLAARFGAVRVFVSAMMMFGVFSALCGFANSLGFLVAARVLQGLAGGPMMPLSQTLMLRIFPKDKQGAAMGLWAMTTLIAPVLGPILGGWICDSFSWPWIFYINVPVALACATMAWRMLKRYEHPLERVPVDKVGLGLLVIWVAALQIMLDEGKQLDWFASSKIWALAIIAAIGFAAFMIWELTEQHPIVDLRVFRHRGFTASVLTISLAFGAFFGANVLTPMWLQSYMGYTATWAGMTTAWSGVLAVLVAPVAAALSAKVDPRPLVFGGVIWLGIVTLLRVVANTDMDYWQIALPLLLMGLGMPFFFVPLNALALASVEESETASAAGLLNFLRTVSGAFATSLVTTRWEDGASAKHAELAGLIDPQGASAQALTQQGMPADAVRATLDQITQGQAVMVATNELLLMVGIAFFIAAFAIWLAPRPTRVVDAAAAGH
ncbi:DHA2 family efflux MFS transporter permease subunit [Niveibacterium sp.]|uniref:DHA2 family efflux MFS transporter permease subunit n=1 Tax=Niveibacterium sp. TaxID=2017444 RepID=UPI0035B00C8B